LKQIRIISPSGAIAPSFIDGAITRLRTWGYKVSTGAHAYEEWGRFAGNDDDRLADLIDALTDETVDLILCSRGGYGLQRIIDRVPTVTKPIIGFSDITALHQLSAISGQPSLHGIMCKHIATLPEDSEPIVALRKALAGETLEYTWPAHELNREGEAEGMIIGGNLSVLYGLQGTPFGLQAIFESSNLQTFKPSNYQKPLLLIEDIAEQHYHIDRMMRNLKMSGVLAQIGGLIVGQFSDCEDDERMNATVYETIKEAVADYDYPVLFDAPIGHVEHNMPVWLGTPARMAYSAASGTPYLRVGRR
jgi:muramoyltetrapeptide carboxypeptidase